MRFMAISSFTPQRYPQEPAFLMEVDCTPGEWGQDGTLTVKLHKWDDFLK